LAGAQSTGPGPGGKSQQWGNVTDCACHNNERDCNEPTERSKAAMRAGRKTYRYNLSFPSAWVIDILGKIDFDFVLSGPA
jgi:hypothetical protein